MYKPNRNFLSQTTFEKAKIEKFGLKKNKLATLIIRQRNRKCLESFDDMTSRIFRCHLPAPTVQSVTNQYIFRPIFFKK